MDIRDEILRLKKERRAVILAHNYQLPEVQDIADFHGDSLGLSIEASKTNAEVIVFCGVYFMAETAKILSPPKTVLIPDRHAGCPMADMITLEDLRKLKLKHPKAKVLCYVNSSAEIKAESDVCCTSANSISVARGAFGEKEEVIFIPDQYLARYTASQLRRPFIYWPGYCPTHVKMLPEHFRKEKEKHPDAEILVHPECTPEVIAVADKVFSTSGMCRYVRESSCKEFIIGTEIGMIYRLKKDNPDKEFYHPTPLGICPNMKRITLEKVRWSLTHRQEEVYVPPETITRARTALEKMIAYK
ncbi:MAG: quinolinate synthase NadA [Candidatus Omnitrophica bacterium]|nr:quinolinate synthase NadA [Candidatus Omnitrophota bacterium]